MAAQWGRKETVVWPPRMPVYSYIAIGVVALLTALLGWEVFHFRQTPFERMYAGTYMRAAVGSLYGGKGRYPLLYMDGPGKPSRLAVESDFLPDETRVEGGRIVGAMLSDDAKKEGRTGFHTEARTLFPDALVYRWLREAVYGGKGPLAWTVLPLAEGAGILIVALAFTGRKDYERFRGLKYGRRLKGPVMCTPREFNRDVRGAGMAFQTAEAKLPLRIPLTKEAQHFAIMGDTGSGKTALVMQMLREIRDREETAVVYDPAGEFIQRFYDPERGDHILNPLDGRGVYWGPAEEMERNAEADAIAASLYQPTTDAKDEFFHQTPAQIFAHLLKQGPSPQELAAWLADAGEIEERVKGTEMAFFIGQKAGPQRAGVLSSLGLVAKSFRLLPTRAEAGNRVWTATDWARERKGWVFITSRPSEREALRPLHSLWIDLLVMRLNTKPKEGQRKVWFVLEEVASLQRLPQLHMAITENRKSENPIVLIFQGKSQIETIYGRLAEAMLSQPATKIFLKTTEPKAAQWVSQAIGSVEIERVRETKFDGTRRGRNFIQDRQIEPLVMDFEIAGLADRHAYLKHGNNVARFGFHYLDIPAVHPAFVPRTAESDELAFDRKTLEPKRKAAAPPEAAKPERIEQVELARVPEPAVQAAAQGELGRGF